jgi:uncharacterized protein (TIGR02284 family)
MLNGHYKELARLLNSLIELDYDAIAAYRVAIERLNNIDDKAALRGFMADHERHVVDLRPYVVRFGVRPSDGTNAMVVVTKGRVMLAAMLGDRAILEAMKTNEDETNRLYEMATARSDWPAELHATIAKNLTDERRHRAYIISRLGTTEAFPTRAESLR